MQNAEHAINLIARLLFAVLFLPAGIAKLSGFESTVGYFTSLGLPLPALAVGLVIAIEIGGGLALLAGYKVRAAALALALFTLAATIIGHAYWAVPAEQVFVQKLMFFKNLAVTGGLLMLAIKGAGRISIDERTASA